MFSYFALSATISANVGSSLILSVASVPSSSQATPCTYVVGSLRCAFGAIPSSEMGTDGAGGGAMPDVMTVCITCGLALSARSTHE